MNIAQFKKLPILGILRGIEADLLEPLLEAVIASGMKTIEIAMNTENAGRLIKEAVKIVSRRLTIGAGTVLDREILKQALDSGASFMVLPSFEQEVVEYCVKNKIPVFPGALTPQEIYNAWKAGASMVKVFPANLYGPKYFKYLQGPFSQIALMAVGGVDKENIVEYFQSGAQAVAVGESVFNKKDILANNFSLIQHSLSLLVKEVKKSTP